MLTCWRLKRRTVVAAALCLWSTGCSPEQIPPELLQSSSDAAAGQVASAAIRCEIQESLTFGGGGIDPTAETQEVTPIAGHVLLIVTVGLAPRDCVQAQGKYEFRAADFVLFTGEEATGAPAELISVGFPDPARGGESDIGRGYYSSRSTNRLPEAEQVFARVVFSVAEQGARFPFRLQWRDLPAWTLDQALCEGEPPAGWSATEQSPGAGAVQTAPGDLLRTLYTAGIAGAGLVDDEVTEVVVREARADSPPESLELLTTLPMLSTVTIQQCPARVEPALQVLARRPQLRTLRFAHVPVPAALGALIAQQTGLEELSLHGAELEPELFLALAELPNLKRLALEFYPQLSQATVNAIGGLTQLESLSLADCDGSSAPLSGSGRLDLRPLLALTHLTTLDLRRSLVHGESLAALREHPTLSRIYVLNVADLVRPDLRTEYGPLLERMYYEPDSPQSLAAEFAAP